MNKWKKFIWNAYRILFDLVDSCAPGDVVTLSGIVKVQSSDEGMLNKHLYQAKVVKLLSARNS